MHFRNGSILVALALVLSMATVALAQSDDDTPTSENAPATAQPGVAPTLFLTLANPVEQDLELPLDTTQLTIQGTTLPGAVVSIDGDLVDTDDQGNFGSVAALDEGANEIDVVASDDQGNQVSTSIFVTRGE